MINLDETTNSLETFTYTEDIRAVCPTFTMEFVLPEYVDLYNETLLANGREWTPLSVRYIPQSNFYRFSCFCYPAKILRKVDREIGNIRELATFLGAVTGAGSNVDKFTTPYKNLQCPSMIYKIRYDSFQQNADFRNASMIYYDGTILDARTYGSLPQKSINLDLSEVEGTTLSFKTTMVDQRKMIESVYKLPPARYSYKDYFGSMFDIVVDLEYMGAVRFGSSYTLRTGIKEIDDKGTFVLAKSMRTYTSKTGGVRNVYLFGRLVE